MNTPEFHAKDRASWRKWLEKNHDKLTAVWLVYDKGEHRKLAWEEIVQEALCFGWIDSQAKTVSDTQSKIYVSKRKPKGNWSKINKAHVLELVAKGLMTPAGQKAIDDAKANGSWDALNKSDNLELPKELIALFHKNPTANKHFQSFSPSSKKIILSWIYSAKRDETKLKRIQETVDLAEQGKKAHH